MDNSYREELTRRAFLQTTTTGAAAAGLGLFGPGALAAPAAKAGRPLLPAGLLGRTKHPVTLISFGAIRLQERIGTRVLKAAIDRGVNLVHTSATYAGGKSVAAIGELFKADKSYRDKVFLCLKSLRPERESEIDDMLQALGTDHADAIMTELHKPEPGRLEAIQKQQDALKKKGKLRHTGFVCHVDMNGVMEMVLDKAPDYFDTTLLAMTMVPPPGDDKTDPPGEKSRQFLGNLKRFREKGIGILAMKSGARSVVTKTDQPGLFQALTKTMLEAGADTHLTSVNSFEQVDMIAKLDLKNPHLTPQERKAADAIRQSRAGACLMCGDCNKVCPQGLPVSDLMRFRMYHEEYGWPDHARAEFARLGLDAARLTASCGDCTVCRGVCPVALAGPDNVRHAASLMA